MFRSSFIGGWAGGPDALLFLGFGAPIVEQDTTLVIHRRVEWNRSAVPFDKGTRAWSGLAHARATRQHGYRAAKHSGWSPSRAERPWGHNNSNKWARPPANKS